MLDGWLMAFLTGTHGNCWMAGQHTSSAALQSTTSDPLCTSSSAVVSCQVMLSLLNFTNIEIGASFVSVLGLKISCCPVVLEQNRTRLSVGLRPLWIWPTSETRHANQHSHLGYHHAMIIQILT